MELRDSVIFTQPLDEYRVCWGKPSTKLDMVPSAATLALTELTSLGWSPL